MERLLMVALPEDRRTEITVEDYLALEANAPVKHEFYKGEIFAMSRARFNHLQIAGNILTRLNVQLENRPNCSAVASDLRVRVSGMIYFYPDVVVACDRQFTDASQLVLTNPTLVVEVTSSSTALYDRTTKLEACKRMPSMQEILIVDQHRVHIDHYSRMDDSWLVREYTELPETLTLDSIDCTLTVNEVYAKVTFTE